MTDIIKEIEKQNKLASESVMTDQKTQAAFEAWNEATKDCGHTVQPNSATARQRLRELAFPLPQPPAEGK